jgi:hypothetical protein
MDIGSSHHTLLGCTELRKRGTRPFKNGNERNHGIFFFV